MKIFQIILIALVLNGALSGILEKQPKANQSNTPKKDRKLYENLTTSYILGDTVDSTDTSHLSLLVSQQKSMDNFKQVGNWLSDIEEKLDDLRDSVNRRVSDMAIGLQRRNQLLGHYTYVGQSFGNPSKNWHENNDYQQQ